MNERFESFVLVVTSFVPSYSTTYEECFRYWKAINGFSTLDRAYFIKYVRFLLSDSIYMTHYTGITIKYPLDTYSFGGDIAVKIASACIKHDIYPYELGMTADPFDLDFSCPWDVLSPYALMRKRKELCVVEYTDLDRLRARIVADCAQLEAETAAAYPVVPDSVEQTVSDEEICLPTSLVADLVDVELQYDCAEEEELELARSEGDDSDSLESYSLHEIRYRDPDENDHVARWFGIKGLFSLEFEKELLDVFLGRGNITTTDLVISSADIENYYELGKRRFLLYACETIGFDGVEVFLKLLDRIDPRFLTSVSEVNERLSGYLFYLYGIVTQLVDIPVAVVGALNFLRLMQYFRDPSFANDELLLYSILENHAPVVVHIIRKRCSVSQLAEVVRAPSYQDFLQGLILDPGGVGRRVVNQQCCPNGCCYSVYGNITSCEHDYGGSV